MAKNILGKREKSMSFQYIAISKIVGCPFDLKKRNKSFCWQKQQLGQLEIEFMRFWVVAGKVFGKRQTGHKLTSSPTD